MKKKKPKTDSNKVLPGWMASYADLFTVMMVFFVLLFAMSVIDEELFQAFLLSYNPGRTDLIIQYALPIDGNIGVLPMYAPPQPPPEPLAGDGGEHDGIVEVDIDETPGDGDTVANIMNTFRTYMAQHEWAPSPDDLPIIEAIDEYGQLRIQFPGADGMLFNSGSAVLLSPALTALDYLAPLLLQFMDDGYSIIVEGHTDNVAMRSAMFPSNRHLSSARASAVVDYLVDTWSIPPQRIFAQGLSEYFPIDTNDTHEGRANNRRVEIVVFAHEAAARAPVSRHWNIPMD